MSLGKAFDYYMQAEDIPRAVTIADYPLLFISGLQQVTHMVTNALTMVPSDSLEAGYLLSRYGLLLNLETGDSEHAQRAFDRATAIAEEKNDATLEIRTLANAADVDWYQMRGAEVLRKSLRAIDLASRVSDPRAEAWPRFLAAYALLASGDLAGASRHAGEMLTKVEILRDRGLLTQAYLINLHISRLVGDWVAARDYCDRGLALEPRHSWLLGLRAILEYETGEFARGEDYLERTLEIMRSTTPGPNVQEYQVPAWAIPMIARITGGDDHFDIAEEAAQVVISSTSSTPRLAALKFGRALISVQQNDAAAAERQYSDLAPLRGFVMSGDPLIIGMTTIDRVLGLLAITTGQIDQGIVHFEDAMKFCGMAGFRPELAWTCCDYADALLDRMGPGDYDKAGELLDQSLKISQELGMHPLAERVTARQQRDEPEPGKTPRYPDRLTPREVEVLRLIAAGKTNQEIGDILFISLKTVTNHITSILNKTGSANRAQATSYAHEHGLV